MSIWITNQDKESETQVIMVDESWFKQMSDSMPEAKTTCPNFGKIITIKDIILTKEPLFWPYLTVQIIDLAKQDALVSGWAAGCEQCFTTISLIDYIDPKDEILEEKDIYFARAQLMRNQEALCIVQDLVDVDVFMKQFEVLDVDMGNLVGDGQGDGDASLMNASGMNGTGPTMRQTAMSNGTSMNILNAAGNDPSKQAQGTVNIFKYLEGRDSNEAENLSVLVGGKKGPAGGGGGFGDNSDDNDSEDDMIGDAPAEAEDIMETGIIIHDDNPHGLDDLTVLAPHKKRENKRRKEQVDMKEEELKAYFIKLNTLTEKKQKDTIKCHMMDIRDEIDYIKSETMDEEKFWGLLALAVDDSFDYGRDILKEGTYEQ